MKLIGFLVLVFLSFHTPAWVGALIAAIALVITIVHFGFRVIKKEKLEILNTIGTVTFCVLFIWFMVR